MCTSDVDTIVRALCMEQCVHWRYARLSFSDYASELLRLNASRKSWFILRIDNRIVFLAEKPGVYNSSQILGGIDANTRRVGLYAKLIQLAVTDSPIDFSLTLGIDVSDGGLPNAAIPVFAFQKTQGSNAILLPDIDFLRFRFYEDTSFADEKPYDQKQATAIFSGSTTGAVVTQSAIRERSIPRIRAAQHFSGSTDVIFKLPSVVQCDSAQTKAIVKSLRLGDRHISYEEQFRHKFMISMDGNGAACSRVFVGLRSNCALVKYSSPERLFYFTALIPWLHFIPVSTDDEVLQVVKLERNCPGYFKPIAHAGRTFAERLLNKRVLVRYTRALLEEYYDIFESWRNSSDLTARDAAALDSQAFDWEAKISWVRPTITPEN